MAARKSSGMKKTIKQTRREEIIKEGIERLVDIFLLQIEEEDKQKRQENKKGGISPAKTMLHPSVLLRLPRTGSVSH